MNSELQQVVNTCIALRDAGKKPSVGMIKAKLLAPLPIPIIIKGLSYWKENKATVKIESVAEAAPASAKSNVELTARVTELEQQVLALRTELKTLQQRFEGEGS